MPHSKIQLRRVVTIAAAVLSLGATGLASAGSLSASAADSERARYEVVFVPSWNGATHPDEYPYSHAKQGLLTPMIGATHTDGFRLFGPGKRPSPGLERLSEMGKHDPLDAEIRAAIDKGEAGQLIELSDGSAGPVHPPVSFIFEASMPFPRISMVGMIAPSPDWFYGVSGVELQRNGAWVPSKSVTVYAWDSGGDAGTTYLAEDDDLSPKNRTMRADTSHFVQMGKTVPVGVMLFKRVPDTED